MRVLVRLNRLWVLIVRIGALFASAVPTAAQTEVRWAEPVWGSFLDPLRWSGPVPLGEQYDALIDAVSGGTQYSVLVNTVNVQTGRVTIDSPDARLVAESVTLDALRGVHVTSGELLVSLGGRLRTPSVAVLPQGILNLGNSYYPVRLDVGTIAGQVNVNAPVTVERTLTLDHSTLRIAGNGALDFVNGMHLTGSGTVLFDTGSAGYIAPQPGPAKLEIGAGVTVQAKQTGTISNAVNYGTLRADPQHQATLRFFGQNRGTIRHDGGNGRFELNGVNEPDGTILTAAPGGRIQLFDYLNRGTIDITDGSLWLDGSTFSNTGTMRLTNSRVNVQGEVTTAQLRTIQRIGGGSTTIAGTLDNRADQWDLNADGTMSFLGRIRGGRIFGPPERLLLPSQFSRTFQGVTLDLPVHFTAGTDNTFVTDGLTVNDVLLFYGDRSLRTTNTLTLGGSGTVMFGYNLYPWPPDSGLIQAANTTLTIAEGLTVRSFEVGTNVGTLHSGEALSHVSLVNRGTIVATTGSMLTIGGRNWKNEGTLVAEPGGMLNLGGTFTFDDIGNVQREGGIVNFASELDITGQTFDLNDTPVGPMDLGSSLFKGGRLVAPGRVVTVRMTGSRTGLYVQGTALALDLDVVDIANVSSFGDLVLEDATIRLLGDNSRLEVSGTTRAITGTGEIAIDAPLVGAPGPGVKAALIGPGITVRSRAPSARLYNENAFGLVSVQGQVLAAQGWIVIDGAVRNSNLIEASGVGGVVRIAQAGTNELGATLVARTGGRLSIEGATPLHNAGEIRVASDGTLDLWTGITGGGEVRMDGTLRVAREFTANVALQQPLRLSPTSELAFTLGGYAPGTGFDLLTVGGGVLGLDGNVRIELRGSFKPLPGDLFELLRYDARTGEFDGVLRGQGAAGLAFTPLYGATAMSVLIDARFRGDANLDGSVNVLDFNIVAANFGLGGRNWHTGDFDGNGVVNLRDFNILAGNFGLSASGPALTPQDWHALAVSVPEPAVAHAIGAFAMVALVPRVRRPVSTHRERGLAA